MTLAPPPLRQTNEHKKFCEACSKFKVKTEVEYYRNTPLDYCTYHYYMVRGRVGRHSLDEYVKASELHSFKTSLPPPKNMGLLRLLEKS